MSETKHPELAWARVAAVAGEARESALLERDVLRLFDEHAAGLRRYLASFRFGPATTDDIVQEVFLGLFRHLQRGRPTTNLVGWLYQVAHNQAQKQRRRAWRAWPAAPIDFEDVRDPAADPEEQLADAQRSRRLRRVVRRMPIREQRCLALRAEGLTYRDIAQVLGISLGAVAKSLSRSLARLAKIDEQ